MRENNHDIERSPIHYQNAPPQGSLDFQVEEKPRRTPKHLLSNLKMAVLKLGYQLVEQKTGNVSLKISHSKSDELVLRGNKASWVGNERS